MTRHVTVRPYKGKRGTTYRLRWRAAGQVQSLTVDTKWDSTQARDAIEGLGCDIVDSDPRLFKGRLWRGEIEASISGRTFADVAREHIDAKTKASPETKAGNHYTLDRMLTDLHDVPVALVDAATVNAWSARQTVAPGTLRQRLILVRSTLSYAQRKGYRTDNPGPDIVMPPNRKRRRHVFTFTDDQVATVLASVRHEVLQSMFEVISQTGLRIGEARALQVGDIDLKHRKPRLHVLRATIGTSRRIGPGKTPDAIRDIPLDPETAELLAGLCAGRPADALVWDCGDHLPWTYPRVYEVWEAALRRAKVRKGAHIHDLRHWHLSALMDNPDVSLVAVQHRAGHASAWITTDEYGATDDDTDAAVVAAVVQQRERMRRARLSVVS